MTERRQILMDGLRLSYLEQGKAVKGQPSLVLLHGLMGCADTFVPLINELDPSLHVVALDLPGAGQSERSQDIDPRLATTAEQVGRFLEVLNLNQPVVLGHSHGGAVAMSLAAHHRRSVRSLILLSPAHPYFDEADPLIRFYLSRPGQLFAHLMPWLPERLQMIGLRRMAGPQSWDTPERLKPYRDNLRTPGTVLHLLRLLQTWHNDMAGLRRALRRPLDTPSLIVWGDCDRAVPLRSAAELRAHLLHSELIALPGIGHRPAEEAPHTVARFVHHFMQQEAPAPSICYSANVSPSHALTASLINPNFESGD
ncbi:MAG: alpha/beta hydrolase [Acidobacteriaceae bacterium]